MCDGASQGPLSDGLSSTYRYVMMPPLANPSTSRPTTRQPSQLPAPRATHSYCRFPKHNEWDPYSAISPRGVCGRPLSNPTSPNQSLSRTVISRDGLPHLLWTNMPQRRLLPKPTRANLNPGLQRVKTPSARLSIFTQAAITRYQLMLHQVRLSS